MRLGIREGFGVGLDERVLPPHLNKCLHTSLCSARLPCLVFRKNRPVGGTKMLTISAIYESAMFETRHEMLGMLAIGADLRKVITNKVGLEA